VDSNIVISGYFFGGIPLKVVNAAVSHQFIWVTSPALIREIQDVMCSEKFGLTLSETQKVMRPLLEVADIIKPQHTLNIIKRCPADNRVLECAVEGECTLIVTGDRRDLLSLESYRHIKIIKARDFLSRIMV
jgi:putative PIN family toxin of toxin-antitoxin system